MKYIICFLCGVLSFKANCQSKISCDDLKNGIYYYYQKNSSDSYLILRENKFQKEVDLKTGDTTIWKIKWKSNCIYTLQYYSSSLNHDSKMKKFLDKHKMVYKISQISDDYYVYDGYFDKITNPLIITDTIWAKEKVKYSNTQLFKQIIDYSEVNNFTDTSKFSLLYIYRPGKLKNLLDNYFIYFDDILMCYAQNNSGYIFKIYKEGSYNIKSKLFTYESSININLKFGNVYFVKSMIHWGLFNHFFNIKFEMIEMQNDLGRAEYEKIRKK